MLVVDVFTDFALKGEEAVWTVAPGVSTSPSRRAAQAGICLSEGLFQTGRYIGSGRLGLRLTRDTVVSERAWTSHAWHAGPTGGSAGTHRPAFGGSLVTGHETGKVD